MRHKTISLLPAWLEGVCGFTRTASARSLASLKSFQHDDLRGHPAVDKKKPGKLPGFERHGG
jgi:hypothetical protein